MTVEEWLGKDNQLGLDIWHKKYQYNNETFDEWLDRVSNKNRNIKRLIVEKKFLFGGRTLSNRGLNIGTNSNCYSRGFVEDDMDDILLTNTQIAKTFKAQGGQGISLSKLRPKGSPIGKYFTSDGIIPFLEMFNTTTASISQGNHRRGALMCSLDVWHKDVLDFIAIKSNDSKINNCNLSVEIDDVFMKYIQDYYLYGKETVVTVKRNYSGHEIIYDVNPVQIYKAICKYAHDHAEPGILYVDRLRNYNMMEFIDDYVVETTNPCGEQPLPKHGCCNLSSINLSEYVLHPFEENACFNLDELRKDLKYIVGAMDDLIDENQNNHALIEQKEASLKWRNVGIGVMGVADMLAKMQLVYGSDNSISTLHDIMHFIFVECLKYSVELGKLRGNFPGYSNKVWDSEFIKHNLSKDEINKLKKQNCLRNSTLLSIAPTGSISTMLNVSGGIEPWFSTTYTRKTVSLNGKETYYTVNIQTLQEWYDKFGNQIAVPDYFITAAKIPWKQRVKLQGKINECIDTAISSTVNLPKETSIDTIEQLYLNAWSVGCKGMTIYVDGSRDPILSTKPQQNTNQLQIHSAPKRPKELPADIYAVKVKGEQFIVLVGLYEGKPYEVFAFRPNLDIKIPNHQGTIVKKSKMHYMFKSDLLTITELEIANENIEERAVTLYSSMLLRHGVDIKYIIKTTKKVDSNITSFSSALCRVLYKYITETDTGQKCPECGGKIINDGGCKHCESCGYSACG